MGIMAKTDLTNQRQVFVEEYVRSGDHLEAAKKAGYKDTHTLRNQACKLRRECADDHLWSERWDRTLEDIFDVQDEVSEAIARRVAPSVTRTSSAPRLGSRLCSNGAPEDTG